MQDLLIDPVEFCRLKENLAGEAVIVEFGRLSKELVSTEGSLRWSLSGAIDALGHSRLLLVVTGVVRLRCQRCLTSLAFDIDTHSTLVVAKDEESADYVEELLDDDDIDVIVVSKELNVANLVEDDALLALPLSPRHEICPQEALTEVPGDTGKAPSPFEVLKNWKR